MYDILSLLLLLLFTYIHDSENKKLRNRHEFNVNKLGIKIS